MKLPFAGQPPETRFFLVICGWAGALGVIYWFVSHEVAGTALLAGLALASGLISVWLIRARRQAKRRASAEGGVPSAEADATTGLDRPFLDESGRLPDPTLAPFAVGLGTLPFLLAVVLALRRPADQPADPWGANSLEWATSSPPPHHNFESIPLIRSERPAFDARTAASEVPGA